MRTSRVLGGLILFGACAAPGASAQTRDLALKPPPPPSPEVELGGQARSYYLFCLAQQASMMRDYVSAMDYLAEAVKTDPDSASLRTELARVHLRLREPELALAEARRAAEIEPGDPEPLRLILDLTMERASREDPLGEETFQTLVAAHLAVLEADPADADTRVSLGRIYYERGLYMQAAAIMRQHVDSHPADPDAALILAQALTRTGDAEEAVVVLERASRVAPDHPELELALADALQSLGDSESAASILERLVAAHPRRVSYRFALARSYLQLERFGPAAREAASLIEGLAQVAAGSGEEAALRAAHMLYIEASERGGLVDQALTGAIVAERRFPDDPRYPMRRAEILLLEGRREEAGAVFDAMRQGGEPGAGGRISSVYLRAGSRQERAGRVEEAEDLLRRAVEADPGNHSALNYLGYMLADRGAELEEAYSLIRRAVHLEGDNGSYLDSLGWVLFRLGRYEEAEEPLLRALDLIPAEAVVHDHLGDLYRAQGRIRAAVEAWSEALRLGIENRTQVEQKIESVGASDDPAP